MQVFTEDDKMKIAVLSGKGGTGKTLVSVNLAAAAETSVYIDCDVEEPNGYLFFKPDDVRTEKVSVWIPFAEEKKCIGCRKCVDFCKFNALAYIKSSLFVFEEICHSCGGCILFCPQGALSERKKVIGEVRQGKSQNATVITGILNPGEASGIPVIKTIINKAADDHQIVLIDCPPGSSCAVMESIKDADYCLLVAEPTTFGVHNLSMVYELVKLFRKPTGAVLNKCLEQTNPAEKFCSEAGIKILARVPFDQDLGLLNSNALIAVREDSRYVELFSGLLNLITQEVQHEAASNS
jgi:MinD superfamily P-loop ATPase